MTQSTVLYSVTAHMGRDPCQINSWKQLYWEESSLLSPAPAGSPRAPDFSPCFSVTSSHVIIPMALSPGLRPA